ncbi:hypothetical protein [Streptomyces sp. KL116D]|uniref:hypothetical protein n=1 Tax=Streptomyces sp. KL116D TaxID=3045152 RepID=UPI00355619B7
MDEPGRYRVTLTLDGVVAMRGHWNDRGTAERKLENWLREQGSPTSSGELVDTDDGTVLASWP